MYITVYFSREQDKRIKQKQKLILTTLNTVKLRD